MGAPYDFADLRGTLSSIPTNDPATFIVGGGAILRTNWESSAESYRNLFPVMGRVCSYLAGLIHRDVFAKIFRNLYMPKFQVGPFLPDRLLSEPSNTAVLSAGAGATFYKNPGLVASALCKAKAVYVREQAVSDLLKKFAPTLNVYAAPDVVVLLQELVELPETSHTERLTRKLRSLGKYTVFQSYPQWNQTPEIQRALEGIYQLTGLPIRLLPIGFCHDDDAFLASLERNCPFAEKLEVNSIAEIILAIVNSDGFVGTSLHGAITAFSYRKPFLFAPSGRSKVAEFLRGTSLPSVLEAKTWKELGEKANLLSWSTLHEDSLVNSHQQVWDALDRTFTSLKL